MAELILNPPPDSSTPATAPAANGPYHCFICGESFSAPIKLGWHRKKTHPDSNSKLARHQCLLCNEPLGAYKSAVGHLRRVHNQSPNSQNLSFVGRGPSSKSSTAKPSTSLAGEYFVEVQQDGGKARYTGSKAYVIECAVRLLDGKVIKQLTIGRTP